MRPKLTAISCGLTLVIAVALPGCSGGGGVPSATEPGDSSHAAFLPPGTSPTPVVLQFPSMPQRTEVTAIVMGFAEDQMEGDWGRQGERPKLYWFTDKLATAQVLSIEAPLVPGLVYLVAADLDDNVDVNRGDLVSAPQHYMEALAPGMALEFAIDRPFSPGPEPGGMDLAARPTIRDGERRSIVVNTSFGLAWLRSSQLMVVGLPMREPSAYEETGRRYPARVAPTFLWVDQRRVLEWPIAIEALVPDGLDVFAVLDLDGNGYPSTGDISSLCACDFERPEPGGAAISFLLESVVPSNEELADRVIFPDIDPSDE